MILSNQVECHNCGGRPYSAHRHDFVECGCSSAADKVCVDGGTDYRRRVHGSEANFTDISITISDKLLEALTEAIEDKSKNTLGKVCNVAMVLRDEAGINITEIETETEDT